MLKDMQAVVLAAGKSTRLNTGNTKLLEKICGQEIILYPLAVLNELNIPITVIVGFQKNSIKQTITKQFGDTIQFIEQQELTGTAAGLRLLQTKWTQKYILVLRGDTPLITADTLEQLYNHHVETNASISFITAHNGDPTGYPYSRLIKKDGILALRKAQELTADEMQEHCCISSGIYIISRELLEAELQHIKKNTITGEYHVSDLVNLASEKGHIISTVPVAFDQIRGVHNHQELWAIEQIKRSHLIKYWMDRGVRFSSAQTVHMDLNVEIGAGSFIGCSVHLLNGTKIGTHCTISPFSVIESSTIGDNTTVHSHSIIRYATIGSRSQVGPFAHVQEDSIIGNQCTIGNFVETKRTTIGDHTKAKHLTYLGDAEIGSHVNIGAGTITCNYDGKKKHTTVIKDYVFIGTNNSLVAPVTIHEKAYTAAGSTITDTVPARALAIGRGRQVNKENYISEDEVEQSSALQEEKTESISFIGAYKTQNDISTKNQ